MLSLRLYDAQCCDVCGFHSSVTEDPDKTLLPEESTCSVCRGTAAYQRHLQAKDAEAEKALGKDAPPETPRPGDGRRVRLRLISPEEAQRHRAEESPAARRAAQKTLFRQLNNIPPAD